MQDLAKYVVVYDDALDTGLCRRMVQTYQQASQFQARNGAGVREGLEDSSWTEVNVTALAEPQLLQLFEMLVQQYYDRYNAVLGLSRPISPIQKISDLMLKQYQAARQDRFQVHFDSIRQHCNRYLVFLWYLNDVAEGGETFFPDLDLRITPKAGRLLMFPPYWMFQHTGLAPLSDDKYILSTYAIY